MTNVWKYYLWISRHATASAHIVLAALQTAERIGYKGKNPASGKYMVWTRAGEEMRLDDLEEASEFLGRSGGVLTLWKPQPIEDFVDIGFDFAPGVAVDVRSSSQLQLEDTTIVDGLTLSVRDSALHYDPGRWVIASDLLWLFIEFAKQFEPMYGYSVDENALEYFSVEWQLYEEAVQTRRDTRHQNMRPFLFWLNYFDVQLVNRMGGIGVFRDLGANLNTIELSSGVAVSLFDNPWDVELSHLKSINSRWQAT